VRIAGFLQSKKVGSHIEKNTPFFTWALMEVFFQSVFSLNWITTSTKEKIEKY
jgi:hypothetical protein